jgi:hypothetical protein
MSILWKLYLGLMGLSIVGSVGITLVNGPHPVYPVADYPILALSLLQLVGLYGYAFKRPILSERFWRLVYPVLVLNLIATLVIGGVRFAADRGHVGVPGVAAATLFTSLFGIPFFLPLLLADRRYAFRSTSAIWKS